MQGEKRPYSDIFSSLPANCFIRKPITNEDFLEYLDRVMNGGHDESKN